MKSSNYVYKLIGSRGSTVYSFALGSNTFHDIVSRSDLIHLIHRYKHRQHSIALFTIVDGVVLFISKRSFRGSCNQLSLELDC